MADVDLGAPVPVQVRLSREVLLRVRFHADKAFVGGRTSVRDDPRGEARKADQLAGQCGEAALSLWLTGNLDAYERERAIRNARPTVGDSGDLGQTNLDIKASVMRAGRDPLGYSLVVSPQERRRGRVYILATIAPDLSAAWLVGWMRNEGLPDKPDAAGVFAGKHVLPASQLRPAGRAMTPYEWEAPEIVTPPTEKEIPWGFY